MCQSKMYQAKKCHVKAVEQTPRSEIVLWYNRATQNFIIGSAFHFVFIAFISIEKFILFFSIDSHDTGYFVSLLLH